MVIAMFMILEQLQIAPEIVRIAFAATMGALALGLALAFGLGGRPVAQRVLEDAYAKGREEAERARYDRRAATATATSTTAPGAGADTRMRSTDASGVSTQRFDMPTGDPAPGSHIREGRSDGL
jgi:hypothetical protein